jgi:branched-chain amino acid transport system permease protein/neutral amino acid transport system permease protein
VNAAVEALGFGIVTASVLALAAVGFTLQFGITNIFNLAFANVMGLAAFAAYSVDTSTNDIWLAAVVAILTGAAASLLVNRLLLQPFIRRGQGSFGMIIVTFAISLLIQYGTVLVWGDGQVSYTVRQGVSGIRLLGFVVTPAQLVVVGGAVIAMGSMHLLLKHTKLGKAMRATAVNPTLAGNCGIRTKRVVDAAWTVSGALAGAAGVAFGLDTASFSAYTHQDLLVLIVAAAVLGGIGQPYGAMAGALVIGISVELSALWISSAYNDVIAFAILGLVLLARPRGLFGGTFSTQEITA